MDQTEEAQEGGVGLTPEELPQMDGSCDACEPDEAQLATQVCHICSFAFCPLHADRHTSSTRHLLQPYNNQGAHGLQSNSNSRAVAGDEMKKVADGLESGDAERKDGSKNDLPVEAEGEGVKGAEAMTPQESGKRDTVRVERLRCKVHGQEGSLYCKSDEKIICVVCAMQGEHRGHEIITLHEAYVWQKNREGCDLLACTKEMGERIISNWTNPEMSADQLEAFVDSQYDELIKLVRLEEKRTLHLVDLKEAFLTASAAEKIAEISAETERLQEEMASIDDQLAVLGHADPVQALTAHGMLKNTEARPRLPEPRAEPVNPRAFGDRDSGPSMDHAP